MTKDRKPHGYWTKERCASEALKYQTRTEFMKGSASAYSLSHTKGWLDELCGHMHYQQHPPGYWTKERCMAEASKYSTRTDFREGSGGAYFAASKNDWMDEICSHMVRPNQYWTKERCAAEALKYDNRKDFSNESAGAYAACIRYGWIDELLSHQSTFNGNKPHGYWTKERCATEALKYKTRSNFHKESKGAYGKARNEGWLDEICSHMNTRPYLGKRYVYEIVCHRRKIVYIGLTFSLERRKWQHENNSSHIIEHFGKVLDLKEVSGPHDPYEASDVEKETILQYRKRGYKLLNRNGGGSLGTSQGRIKWTKERCSEEALKYDSIKELRKHCEGAYQKASQMGWVDEICSHMRRTVMPSGYWHDKENCKSAAAKCNTKQEFVRKFYQAWYMSRENGWYDEITTHFQKPKKKEEKYPFEYCMTEAAKYKTRKEFITRAPRIYDYCSRRGWLEDAVSHMVYVGTPKGYWTKERCINEAKKYITRGEFINKSGGAYNASKREGWLDDVCSHMLQRWSTNRRLNNDLFGPITQPAF